MTSPSPKITDPRVAAAISHWAPRFVANGIILSDFEEVTAEITSWDDWCAKWSARAAVHEALGHASMTQGHALTAGEHWNRAGVYYHFAKFLFVNDMAQLRAAHMKAVECRALALPHLRPAGERVEIPYQGKYLAGILRKPAGVKNPPVIVMCMGLDSAKEEMETNEAPFLARGVATLVFDGPGQGEGEYDFALRHDYEVPVGAVVDYLHTRADIDAARVGLWGVSLGGYFASRAAAFEKRIKACVALSGPYDWAHAWEIMPQLTREAFRARSHLKTLDEARAQAAKLSLKEVAGQITCPLYLVAGKLDRIVPWQHCERLAAEVKGPVEVMLLDDGNHVANNRTYRYRSQSADWMAAHLTA